MRAAPIVLAVGLLGPSALSAADFLGPESCQGCHPQAYAIWKQSQHARARAPLSPQQQRDAKCQTCHSPNSDQIVANVTCETCHGGGQYYVARYVMKDPELARLVGLQDPSERSCRTCHDSSSPSLRPFDFLEKLKAIDHWTGEREARNPSASSQSGGKAKKGAQDH